MVVLGLLMGSWGSYLPRGSRYLLIKELRLKDHDDYGFWGGSVARPVSGTSEGFTSSSSWSMQHEGKCGVASHSRGRGPSTWSYKQRHP